MREVGRLWWCALLYACSGGHAPPAASPSGSASGSASASASCPPAGSASCRVGDRCTHGDVTCTCERQPWCKGAAPTEEEENATTWDCVGPPVPGECPHDEPTAGAACSLEGQKCDYSCGCIRGKTCTGGVWTAYRGACSK